MKRQIICKKCQQKTRKLFPTDTPYPKEHVKFVDGTAKRNFKCDSCYKDILTEESCCAFTIWADYGGIPYYAWEDEFINF